MRGTPKGTRKLELITKKYRLGIVIALIVFISKFLFFKNIDLVFSEIINIERVSVDANMAQANNLSEGPVISDDGNYIAFVSEASNLVLKDNNGKRDVFVKNRRTGEVEIVSISDNGELGNADTYLFPPSISSDGRYIVFGSLASNIVANDDNGYGDIFLYDRQIDKVEMISIATDGTQGNDHSGWGDERGSCILDNGRYVVFMTYATNLVPGVYSQQMIIRDRQAQTTDVVSLDSDENPIGSNGDCAISSDGRFVAFKSTPGNSIWFRDRLDGTTSLITQSYSGEVANNGSQFASMSSDGKYVVFHSFATNLVENDTNGEVDIFLKNMQNGEVELLSKTKDNQANGSSVYPTISSDGRYVVFSSSATNLIADDKNNLQDVFVYDRTNTNIELASKSNDGSQGNNSLYRTSISSGGNFIVFLSHATNLVSNDTNGESDVFLFNRLFKSDEIKPSLPETGFSPFNEPNNQSLPQNLNYKNAGSLYIHIPRLKVNSPIVGIPLSENGWDIKWLRNKAGWLEGSSFPTWAGNSVITGHNNNYDGTRGIFANIGSLKWGDEIIITFGKQNYIYEVREVINFVNPVENEYLSIDETYPWITLVTCQGYDKEKDNYRWRLIVRAIQTKID